MKTTKQLVKFDFDLAVITALDAKYKDIQITDGKSYAVVMQGLAEYRDLRLRIDDMHKELKKDILEAGRSLDGDKNRLKALLEPGENHLKEIRQVEDDRKAKIKEEKDRKERERIDGIQGKINSIRSQGMLIHGAPSSIVKERLIIMKGQALSQEVYMEFMVQAIEAHKTAVAELETALSKRLQFEKEETERKAEAERLEAQRKEQEAAQAKIDEENRKIHEKNIKLAQEEKEIEAKKKAEADRKEKEEFERQATIKAETEAKEKAEKEEQTRKLKAEAEEKEKQRKAAMAPDREKLYTFTNQLDEDNLDVPKLKSKEAQELLKGALGDIFIIANNIRRKADSL